jgi:ABC-type sugar transport system ATPase subunit
VATLALKTETAHLLFQAGRVEVLLGPRGSGKTRLLRALAGLDRIPGARVYAGGVEVTGWSPFQRRVRYVPRGGAAYPARTVLENLMLPGVLPDQAARARQAAALFGLSDVLDARADRVDPALRQRLALAKAAVSGATAVLLDEPFEPLDAYWRARLPALLRDTFVGRDRILVVATASPAAAAPLAGSVHVVQDGAVLQRGSLPALLAEPADERVARALHPPALAVWPIVLMKDRTLGRVVQLGDRLVAPAPSAWDALPLGKYRIGILPPHVHFVRHQANDLEVAAQVAAADPVEGHVWLTALAGQRELVASSRERLEPAHEKTAYFSLGDVLLFTVSGQRTRGAHRPSGSGRPWRQLNRSRPASRR